MPELAPLLATTLLVGTMTDRELRRAIEEPAGRAGLRLEPGLTDAIVADVGNEPGGLPLLSTALLETWVRRHDSTLTLAGYADAGGVSGALTHLAESVYARFSPDEQESCRRIMLRLAEPGEGDDDVRRRALPAELVAPDDRNATTVLATLTDQRLVTAGADGVEVAHEALLREWPRARAWLEDDRDGRRLHHHLAASAAGWEAEGRDPAELYRGARLASALDWSTAHPGEANRLEREFLDTASAAHDAELRTARRSARRLRALLAATAVLLVVAIAAGSLSLVQRGEARDRARAADLTRLAAQAATLDGDQLSLGLLLGVEGRRLDPSDTTESALGAALDNVPDGLERLIPVPGGVGYANVSPNRRRFVTAGSDGKARIVDGGVRADRQHHRPGPRPRCWHRELQSRRAPRGRFQHFREGRRDPGVQRRHRQAGRPEAAGRLGHRARQFPAERLDPARDRELERAHPLGRLRPEPSATRSARRSGSRDPGHRKGR